MSIEGRPVIASETQQSDSSLTIEQFVRSMVRPNAEADAEASAWEDGHPNISGMLLDWPYDMFAVTASILRQTGGYVRAVDVPYEPRKKRNDRGKESQELAGVWLDRIALGRQKPTASGPPQKLTKPAVFPGATGATTPAGTPGTAGPATPGALGPDERFAPRGVEELWSRVWDQRQLTLKSLRDAVLKTQPIASEDIDALYAKPDDLTEAHILTGVLNALLRLTMICDDVGTYWSLLEEFEYRREAALAEAYEFPREDNEEEKGWAGRQRKLLIALLGETFQLVVPQQAKEEPITLCKSIVSDSVVVLPKWMSPSMGMTVRSITQRLALVPAGEVAVNLQDLIFCEPLHHQQPTPALPDNGAAGEKPSEPAAPADRGSTRDDDGEAADPEPMNGASSAPQVEVGEPVSQELTDEMNRSLTLLLLPWPTEVVPSRFEPSPGVTSGSYFDYKPPPWTDDDYTRIAAISRVAHATVAPVDGIVLPEAAMSNSAENSDGEFDQLTRQLDREGTDVNFLIAGIMQKQAGRFPTNAAALWFKGPYVDSQEGPPQPDGLDDEDRNPRINQDKHHRWCLDDRQIRQYNLGSRLNPRHRWWEATCLGDRNMNFQVLTPDLLMAVLICEDLARSEPVAETIRSVGPNLLIALLADGPQIGSRWSARYAASLADDPGTSVLTLTSLGMAKLSRSVSVPTERSRHERCIALWKDAITGTKQLTLDPDAEAILVTLVQTAAPHNFRLADGRPVSPPSQYLTLGGVAQIPRDKVQKEYIRLKEKNDGTDEQQTTPGQ